MSAPFLPPGPLLFNILPNIGGFNPSEKYWSKWESSLNTGEHKTYLKPPPRTRTPSFKKTSLHYKIYISPSSTRHLSVVTLTPFKFQVPPKRGRCLKSQEYYFTHTNFPPNRKNNTSETLNSHPLPSKTSIHCLLYQLPKFIFFKTSTLVKQTFSKSPPSETAAFSKRPASVVAWASWWVATCFANSSLPRHRKTPTEPSNRTRRQNMVGWPARRLCGCLRKWWYPQNHLF